MKIFTALLLIISIIGCAVCTVEGRYHFSQPNYRRRLGFWTGAQYTPRYSEQFGGTLYAPKFDEGADDYDLDDGLDDYDLDDYDNRAGSGMRRLGTYCNGSKCFYTNPALKRECDYGYAGTYWSYYSKSQCL